MTSAIAVANLRSLTTTPRQKGQLLQLMLKVEAWLDRRASSRALYTMDDRALADIGLSRADVERVNEDTSWQSHLLLPVPVGRR